MAAIPGATSETLSHVCAKPDVVLRLDLRDQDTTTRKRNRDAQRNHRERKRVAAAVVARQAAEGRKPPVSKDAGDTTRRSYKESTQQNNFDASNHRFCDAPNLPNPTSHLALFGSKDKPSLDLDDISDESWSSMMEPGLPEHAVQAATNPFSSQSDLVFNSFMNNPSQELQQTSWNQDSARTGNDPQNLYRDQYGCPPSPISHGVNNPGMTMNMDNRCSSAGNQPQTILDRRKSKDLNLCQQLSETQIIDNRFEAILEAVDSAGFHSFDDMAATYYTSPLGSESSLRATQKFSRERELKSLLKALRQSAKAWPDREAWAYQDEILLSARQMLSDELSNSAGKGSPQSRLSSSQGSVTSSSSSGGSTSGILESLKQLLREDKVNQLLKEESSRLRGMVPDAFDLLAKLAQNAKVSQPLNSQIVALFLHLLVDGILERERE